MATKTKKSEKNGKNESGVAQFADAYGGEDLPGGGRRFAQVSVFGREEEVVIRGKKTTVSKPVLELVAVDGREEVLDDLAIYPAWHHAFRQLYLTNYEGKQKGGGPKPRPACVSVDGVTGRADPAQAAHLSAAPGYNGVCDGCPFAVKGAVKSCRGSIKLYGVRAEGDHAGEEVQIQIPFVAVLQGFNKLDGDLRTKKLMVAATTRKRQDGSGTYPSMEFQQLEATPAKLVGPVTELRTKAMDSRQLLLPAATPQGQLPAGEKEDEGFGN